MAPPNLSYDRIKIGDIIPNSYIVVLKPQTPDAAFKEHRDWVCSLCLATPTSDNTQPSSEPYNYVYNFETLKGYSGTFSKAIIDKIALRPDIEYVEPNKVIGIPEDEAVTPADHEYGDYDTTWTTENYDSSTEPVGISTELGGIESRQKSVFRSQVVG